MAWDAMSLGQTGGIGNRRAGAHEVGVGQEALRRRLNDPVVDGRTHADVVADEPVTAMGRGLITIQC